MTTRFAAVDMRVEQNGGHATTTDGAGDELDSGAFLDATMRRKGFGDGERLVLGHVGSRRLRVVGTVRLVERHESGTSETGTRKELKMRFAIKGGDGE